MRLAECVAQNGDILQRHRRAQAGSDRLGEGLFGGEAFRQETRWVAAGGIACVFCRGEDALGVRSAKARAAAADAFGIEQIGADAMYQAPDLTTKP